MWKHRTIIVPASHVAIARSITAAADPAGAGMFTTALSADGNLPASHYISNGFIREQFALIMDEKQADMVYAIAQAAGLELTLDQATELFSVSDISSDGAQSALCRLGLQLCREA